MDRHLALKAHIFPSKVAGINVTLPLLALFIATFCTATTELAVVGLISDIARDLVVSIPKAGLLVSGYALGVAVGGPVFTIATASSSRKIALLSMMSEFVADHALAAVAPNYAVLMIARVIAVGSVSQVPFIGLPGNPVASFGTCAYLARAVVFTLAGIPLEPLILTPVRSAFTYEKKAGRREYLRAKIHRALPAFRGQERAVSLEGLLSDGDSELVLHCRWNLGRDRRVPAADEQ